MVPLLFESGRYADWLQRVITVDCPEESQIARTMQRSKLDEPAVRAIMAQQLSREERLTLSDEIIAQQWQSGRPEKAGRRNTPPFICFGN